MADISLKVTVLPRYSISLAQGLATCSHESMLKLLGSVRCHAPQRHGHMRDILVYLNGFGIAMNYPFKYSYIHGYSLGSLLHPLAIM